MIIGERIQLIPLNDECFELTLKWVNSPDLRLYLGTRFPVSKIEHEKWFNNKSKDMYNKTFAIQIKETMKIIGLVGNNDFEVIDRTTSAFIYIGETDTRGSGYGKESLTLFANFCYESLNIRKIWAHVFEFNKTSLGLFNSLGFNNEGFLIEHVYRNGKYHNVIVLGKIYEKYKT